MDSNERRHYESTGHGGTLAERAEAFRRQTTPPVVCAWCAPATQVYGVSHGICADCKARIEMEG